MKGGWTGGDTENDGGQWRYNKGEKNVKEKYSVKGPRRADKEVFCRAG